MAKFGVLCDFAVGTQTAAPSNYKRYDQTLMSVKLFALPLLRKLSVRSI
jgi:hypothetical protein